MFNLCMDYAYLLVDRVNIIGENSNFSSQLRAELHCASLISYRFVCKQYHVIVSSDHANHSEIFIQSFVIVISFEFKDIIYICYSSL